MSKGIIIIYLINLFLISGASLPQVTTTIYAPVIKLLGIHCEGLISNPIWTFLCGSLPTCSIYYRCPIVVTRVMVFIGLILPFFYSWGITLLLTRHEFESFHKYIIFSYTASLVICIPVNWFGNIRFLYWTTY
ncbi:MAG: hypothetical protein JXR78_06285 [Victivallales bacterium]|nr:hypothetical protein [Victivallales bacterium]